VDGALVLDRRVDDDAVMAALVGQEHEERAQGVGADAASLEAGPDEQVDAGMAVVEVGLFRVLDTTGDLSVGEDGEDGAALFVYPLPSVAHPPARDLGLAQHGLERRDVAVGDRAQDDLHPVKDGAGHAQPYFLTGWAPPARQAR